MRIDKIFQGDVLSGLKKIESGSVQTCVTSPPYFGLRDYGMKGQIGLEETPEAFAQKMVEVFREVRRVLRDDGTLWLNLGDSYNSNAAAKTAGGFQGRQARNGTVIPFDERVQKRKTGKTKYPGGKPKDLIGIPWRVAFALQAHGWYLRQDIIWHKPNPMPESVTDRCTKAHEYIFLLSKSKDYYFDHKAIMELAAYDGRKDTVMKGSEKYAADVVPNKKGHIMAARAHERWQRGPNGEYMRNRRSVWTVTTKPYRGAHFATFPPDLIVPCILAGSPEGGLILDPFMGSGTTAAVAKQHGRRYVGCELNPEYIKLAEQRIAQVVVQPKLVAA